MKLNIYLGFIIGISTLFFAENVCAETTVVRSGSCGTGCYYTEDSEGLLKITGDGNGVMNFGGGFDSSPWYQNTTIKKVVIDGVKNIAQFAFRDASSIGEIVIGNSVTNIDQWGLADIPNLTKLSIPSSVQSFGSGSLKSIGYAKFLEDGIWDFQELIISDTTVLPKNAFYNQWASGTTDGYMKSITIICEGDLEKCKANLASQGIENSFAGIILKDHPIPKRIYTIEEATAALGKTGKNTFKLRYR